MPDSQEEINDTDIEQAYQKALAAMEVAEWGIDEAEGSPPSTAAPGTLPVEFESQHEGTPPGDQSIANPELIGEHPVRAGAPTGIANAKESKPATGPRLAPGTEPHPSVDPEAYSNVTPAQVIESALFVGGIPLTSKKICALLRNSFDVQFVERTIDELNDQYVVEGRPYEIRLGDGGYRLELRPEYEKLRQRAYGSGPREVKLSQDILEVLALVAYRQPISQAEIESHGKQNAGNLLRQLLRRDLIAIQRGDGGRKDVSYLTTPRFLTVFGIGSLDELPEPDDLARK